MARGRRELASRRWQSASLLHLMLWSGVGGVVVGVAGWPSRMKRRRQRDTVDGRRSGGDLGRCGGEVGGDLRGYGANTGEDDQGRRMGERVGGDLKTAPRGGG